MGVSDKDDYNQSIENEDKILPQDIEQGTCVSAHFKSYLDKGNVKRVRRYWKKSIKNSLSLEKPA